MEGQSGNEMDERNKIIFLCQQPWAYLQGQRGVKFVIKYYSWPLDKAVWEMKSYDCIFRCSETDPE